jgi:hypothetical protein
MSSIIKVDRIQLADGSTPTAGDLGLNTTGSVLQVVQSVHDYKDNYQLNATWSQITALNTAITPSSTSSKILIDVVIYIAPDVNNNPYPAFRLTKGGLVISDALGTAAGVRKITTAAAGNMGGSDIWAKAIPMKYLDSPATTDELTYGVQIVGYDNRTIAVNASGTSEPNSGFVTISTMTLWEIAG